MSKNTVTIEHLQIACRHVDELMQAGVTENHAIRTLELFSDYYAKVLMGGSVVPHHVDQVTLWSVEALKIRKKNPEAKAKDHFRVEHGTPRRSLARMIMKMYREEKLTQKALDRLMKRRWKLAVITLEEDSRLNKVARSRLFKTPEARWAAAGIKFPKK